MLSVVAPHHPCFLEISIEICIEADALGLLTECLKAIEKNQALILQKLFETQPGGSISQTNLHPPPTVSTSTNYPPTSTPAGPSQALARLFNHHSLVLARP